MSTAPGQTSEITCVCKQCAADAAMPIVDGIQQQPDKQSVDNACYLLDKPMLDSVWESSLLEAANQATGNQPFLYSQLIGFLDSSEEGNDDMMRISSIISIVRSFLQLSNIDDMIASLSADPRNAERNISTIRALQQMKSQITQGATKLAEQSCISLKNSKNSIKGENTWTGKIQKIKDLNLREAQVNGFDIATCRGMQQVQEISDASIMKQLALDESEWSDMVATMREDNQQLRRERDSYKEINRILLRENLDLKDYMEENGVDISVDLQDLKELYSPFSNMDEEVEDDESDNTSE